MQQKQEDELIQNRYRILEQIGEGASGKVFKGKDTESNMDVAIKIQSIWKQREYDLLLNFKNTTFINVINVYDVFNIENITNQCDELFIIMEYAAGGNLFDYLQNHKLDENERNNIFLQISKGLQELHEKNFLFRDMKPENIIVLQDKHQKYIFKLCDFGLVKKEDLFYTKKIGTPYYLAPEILIENENTQYNSKVDIWALGCLFYEIITKECLFNAISQEDLFQKIKKTQQEEIDNKINQLIEYKICQRQIKLIKFMISKDPLRRPNIFEVIKTLNGSDEIVNRLQQIPRISIPNPINPINRPIQQTQNQQIIPTGNIQPPKPPIKIVIQPKQMQNQGSQVPKINPQPIQQSKLNQNPILNTNGIQQIPSSQNPVHNSPSKVTTHCQQNLNSQLNQNNQQNIDIENNQNAEEQRLQQQKTNKDEIQQEKDKSHEQKQQTQQNQQVSDLQQQQQAEQYNSKQQKIISEQQNRNHEQQMEKKEEDEQLKSDELNNQQPPEQELQQKEKEPDSNQHQQQQQQFIKNNVKIQSSDSNYKSESELEKLINDLKSKLKVIENYLLELFKIQWIPSQVMKVFCNDVLNLQDEYVKLIKKCDQQLKDQSTQQIDSGQIQKNQNQILEKLQQQYFKIFQQSNANINIEYDNIQNLIMQKWIKQDGNEKRYESLLTETKNKYIQFINNVNQVGQLNNQPFVVFVQILQQTHKLEQDFWQYIQQLKESEKLDSVIKDNYGFK